MTVRRKVSPAQAAVARSAAVRKASKPDSSWVALYDENGTLLGIADPKNITPVANGGSLSPTAKTANENANMPVPQQAEDATQASGQQSAMGSRQPPPKRVAGVPVSEVDDAEDLRKRAAQVRKGLYGDTTAREQVELANGLNRAAISALDIVHGRQSRRRG